MNKIEEVVIPLKEDAVKRAEQEAKAIIERCTKTLAENDNDLRIVAPYPRYGNYTSRNDYILKMTRRNLYSKLVKHRTATCRLNEPEYVDICPERTETYIKNAKEDAAAQYDAFVAKLVSKVGEVQNAELTGNHVWSFSILVVTKPDGSIEKWKTQMIVNVSKLGKVFNQWPTRKVK